MSTFFVYGLYDPLNWDKPRYIGAASRIDRPLQHEAEARTKNYSYKINWIRKVLSEGRYIGWKVLAACNSWKDTLKVERELIQKNRKECKLTNLTDGGEGVFNPTPESRLKMRNSHLGQSRPFSLEHRRKISLAKTGQKKSREHLEKLNAGKRAYHAKGISKEHREKIIQSLKNRVISVETREKLRVLHLNKKRSEETRKRISEGKKGKLSIKLEAHLNKLNKLKSESDAFSLSNLPTPRKREE